MSTRSTSSISAMLDALERKLPGFDGLDEDLRDKKRTTNVLNSVTTQVRALESQATGSNATDTSKKRRIEELEAQITKVQATIKKFKGEWQGAVKVLKEQLEEVNVKVNLTALAVANQSFTAPSIDYGRPKLPQPKYYGGARDAEELENFLFDMEQYFRAVRPDCEDMKIVMASICLTGDAKLWWRIKYKEIQEHRCTINSWEDLKRELKSEFLPENVAYIA